MTVYVDAMRAQFGRMKLSHMCADTLSELLIMADAVGVRGRWLQRPAFLALGTPHPLYADDERYAVGMEVDSGVRLDAVYADRVELLRNGRRESLAFPRQHSGQYNVYTPPAAPVAEEAVEELDQLEQDNLEELRQRMQMLREQMEASGAVAEDPPTDQPMESD